MLSSCFERRFACHNLPGDELIMTVSYGHLFLGTICTGAGEHDVQLSKDQVRDLIEALTEAVNERMTDVEPIECN
ncbi:hypothetical protein D3C81_1595560 [compost metagenome]